VTNDVGKDFAYRLHAVLRAVGSDELVDVRGDLHVGVHAEARPTSWTTP